MRHLILTAGVIMTISCTFVAPKYIVRHGPNGSATDLKELRVSEPGFKLYATAGSLIVGGIIANVESGRAADFLPGALMGAGVGLVADLSLAIMGVYSGPTRIYSCKNLHPSHRAGFVIDMKLLGVLKELDCELSGKQF